MLKYAGAKRWLAKLLAIRLHAYLTKVDGVYVEPFAGSLALGLAIGWPQSVYSDVLSDLANLYSALAVDADAVANEIDILRKLSGSEAYYAVRKSVWPEERRALTSAGLAARTIWLNKNGFNGLTRFSKTGRFNVPWGKRENVALPSRDHLKNIGQLLSKARIMCMDFERVLDEMMSQPNPLVGISASRLIVYLDPPYSDRLKNVSPRGAEDRPGKDQGVFTGYSGKFTREDQVRLADKAQDLAARGALVIASNSWTDEVCDLYRARGFSLFQVGVRHCVGATEERRGRRAEMIAVTHPEIMESAPAKIVCRR